MRSRAFNIVIAEDPAAPTIRRALSLDPDAVIAAVASDALQAVTLTKRYRPDAVVVDARVPGVGGFEATRRIMFEVPTPIIIVADDLDQSVIQITMEALRAGALAVALKPMREGTVEFAARAASLVETVRAMADVKVVRRWEERRKALRTAGSPPRYERARLAVVAIGASTGGPGALYSILRELRADFPVPILVTQHISRGFASGMVRWLDDSVPLNVKLAEQGEALKPSTVYVAPDDRHLTVWNDSTIALKIGPMMDGHRPSATVLFQSVAAAFGPRSCAVILTGMGRDGTDGLRAIRQSGGTVLAQDEATCAVFGMPKAAIDAGLAQFVLPLEAIASHLTLSLSGARGICNTGS